MPDAEWIAYAKTVRQYLNDQLANADRLSAPQLLDIASRLKDIAGKMQQYEKAAGSDARCGGTITTEGDTLVVVATAASGSLVVTCR